MRTRNESEMDFEASIFALHVRIWDTCVYGAHRKRCRRKCIVQISIERATLFLSNDNPVHTVASIYQLSDISLVAIANRQIEKKTYIYTFSTDGNGTIAGIQMSVFVLFMSSSMAFWLVK